jgi:hypothetical protein
MAKMESPIRGRWCELCQGRGSIQGARFRTDYGGGRTENECPRCHWTGFVGVTSEQVREAELREKESA